MAGEEMTSPRPGTVPDLVRRVERLEDVTKVLGASVVEVNHRLDIVDLNQKHQIEMMGSKFKGIEEMLHANSSEVAKITNLIQAAMAGDPQATSPYAKRMMDEYMEFVKDVRTHIANQEAKNEEVEDFILVQKTRAETTKSIVTRAFGSSIVGAVGGLIGILAGAYALLHLH